MSYRPDLIHVLFRTLLLLLLCNEVHAARTLEVGPTRTLKTPGDAAKVAEHGDTILIDAAVYENDYAIWHADNLTIQGVGGMAHIRSNQLIPNGKGIWITNGNNTHIERIEFSGARVAATNGAGLRHQGGDLLLRNTYFHHNEFSLLTGPNPRARIMVLDSKFWHQQRSARFSHGIYIGKVGQFTIEGSHFLNTDQGHQIKSRALTNFIRYNRIEEDENGNSSRLVDLPNCGYSVIMGNEMHQAVTTENTDVIGYGAEGCDGRSPYERTLYVLHNTLVNEASAAALVHNHDGKAAIVGNNLLFGNGIFLSGNGIVRNNIRLDLAHRKPGGWLPDSTSSAERRALSLQPETATGNTLTALIPEKEFKSPVGTRKREKRQTLSVGAKQCSEAIAAE